MLRKFILLMLAFYTYANALQDPAEFMQQVTSNVVVDLNKLPNNEKNQNLYDIINTKILPQVDIEYMARWVVGRTAWMQATDAQKKSFIKAYTTLLSRTYSSTLLSFKDREMKYYRIGNADYQQLQRVQVICEIQQPNKEPIKAIYQLHLVQGEWKIFDILVEGVSMLKGLQAQFVDIIAREGIEGATNLIHEKLTNE
jgi:phospholipid transport system substrate-binding protein